MGREQLLKRQQMHNFSIILFQWNYDVALRERWRAKETDLCSSKDRNRGAELPGPNATMRRQKSREICVTYRGETAGKFFLIH
jgi:hypothetical protein